jgi:hypothetical protein
MTVHQVVVGAVLASFVVGSTPLRGTVPAQSAGAAVETIWENDRIQVSRVSLAPGEKLSGEAPGGSVIVFLTTDLDGRVPPAEAAWLDPGALMMENRGRARFEAVVVDLKRNTARAGGVTAPEVVRASGTVGPRFSDGVYARTMRAENLVLNDLVSVTRERYDVAGSADPLHFHPQDSVVIYLRGGYVWPAMSLYGPERVRRGDVRVLPGNVFHTNGNASNDPLEFLLIIPS